MSYLYPKCIPRMEGRDIFLSLLLFMEIVEALITEDEGIAGDGILQLNNNYIL